MQSLYRNVCMQNTQQTAGCHCGAEDAHSEQLFKRRSEAVLQMIHTAALDKTRHSNFLIQRFWEGSRAYIYSVEVDAPVGPSSRGNESVSMFTGR